MRIIDIWIKEAKEEKDRIIEDLPWNKEDPRYNDMVEYFKKNSLVYNLSDLKYNVLVELESSFGPIVLKLENFFKRL